MKNSASVPVLISALLFSFSSLGWADDATFGMHVPNGAKSGDLSLSPCEIYLEGDERSYPGDCGTLVVPENRNNPNSRLIALPVERINAASGEKLEAIFWFSGGPGNLNKTTYPTDGLLNNHDFVMVGYRGISGQVHLQCPEISDAMRETDSDYFGKAALSSYGKATKRCSDRLIAEGVDIDGYTINQTIADNEAARKAFGYQKINLFSESYGTRIAMLYQWQHPDSIHRTLMQGVNPPGHFLFDPTVIDQQLGQYSALCAKDSYCSARTNDLYQTMQQVSKNMPKSWFGIKIDPQLVKFISYISMHESMPLKDGPPIYGPAMIDMWLDAMEGDASGMALVSLIAPMILPEAFDWGHFLSMGTSVTDFTEKDRDYYNELTPDTILGSPVALLIWGTMSGWPITSDQSTSIIPDSDTETLLISGSIDGSVPPQYATDELLPHLTSGHQVILSDFAHSETFWQSQDEARAHLITGFFDRGVVDDSLYEYQTVIFDVESSWSGLAKKILAGVLIALLVLVFLITLGVRKFRNKSH